jgi:putative FmdB family regulatory protein
MPIYEYQCNDCEHRFELLRSSREASMDQPCPDCDADSRRVMSRQWSAFTFRDGRARQLPDDGGYYHLGKKVTQPITGGVRGVEHPEIDKEPPPKPLTVEEMEQYEYVKEYHVDYVIRTGTEPVDASGGGAEKEFQKRVRRRGSVREEQVKRRVGANVRKLEYKKLTRGG